MITKDEIPPKSRGAAEEAFKRTFDLNEAIAAAINAWPGKEEAINSQLVILPLPEKGEG